MSILTGRLHIIHLGVHFFFFGMLRLMGKTRVLLFYEAQELLAFRREIRRNLNSKRRNRRTV